MKNMLGPLKLIFTGSTPYGHIIDSAPAFRLVLGFLSAIQSLISIILLFLAALALRRQFQIN
ncbi:hypothetical protein [Hyphobacterium sp.]|jgi:hypothetical protein|uniref:hypothetical protein n=1 Tax=Hyphobacterium sp. TaxID=2004662 RepID=UPI003BABED51